MSKTRGEGLRKLRTSAEDQVKRMKNADYSRAYREKKKKDLDYVEQNKQKCKAYRRRPLTDEQLEAKREASRRSSKKYRDAKKLMAAKENTATKKSTPKPKTRTAVQSQRDEWKQQKKTQRQNWSSQKWRRHREKCAAYNREKRNEARLASEMASQHKHRMAQKETECAAEESAPLHVTSSSKKGLTSPSPRKLKAAYQSTLVDLWQKRNRAALAKKKLLFSLVAESEGQDVTNLYKRKKEFTATSAAREFFHDQGIDAPGKRSVSKRTKQQKKILPKRMKRLHRQFLEKNPSIKISLRTFYRTRPKHILTSSKLAIHQCLCERCANIDLKLDVLNKHLQVEVNGRDVLSDLSLCHNQNTACLDRKCSDCGTKIVEEKLTLKEGINRDSAVSWKRWETVKNESGKKRKMLVDHNGTVESLIRQLMTELEGFPRHVANFKWQFMQMKSLLAALPQNWAVVIMDFAENFQCRYQNEIQSVYWSYNQITVHPCVLHYNCPDCEDQVTEQLIFLSDDLKHDPHFVRAVQYMTIQHLRDIIQLEKVVFFSDGCPTQYKSKVPFYFLANDVPGVAVERCFFGSRHGKSECDAAGGVVKRLLEDDIITGSIIQNASDAYKHSMENFVLPEQNAKESCSHRKRSFMIIKPADVDRSLQSSSVQTVRGTRTLHSFKSAGQNRLAVRRLSCFCTSCLAGKFTECPNDLPWVEVEVDGPSKDPPHSADLHSYPPVSSSMNHADSEPCRSQYFEDLLAEINSCQSYAELETVISASEIKQFPLPETLPRTVVDVSGQIDKMSLQFCPDTLTTLFPVWTKADGNCLPRAAGILIFGNQDQYHVEMRCRIIGELVSNKELYIQGVGMGGSDVAAQVAAFSNCSTVSGTPLPKTIHKIFENETMEVRGCGVPMGLWQLAALSNLLGTTVLSVYPKLGWPHYQELGNRALLPLETKRQQKVSILWTSNRSDMPDQHWVANHFVPLMPITDAPDVEVEDVLNTAFNKEEVELNDFFIVEWQGSSYVAQVHDLDREMQLVHLSFMTRASNGLYTWPSRDDMSWESFDVLQEKVLLELNVQASNQRLQFYQIVRG